MTCECVKKQGNKTYLIIHNNKTNQVLQAYLWREWGENPPDCIARIVSRCIIHVCCVLRAVLVPPSLSYKPATSAPHDRGNISHDPTCDSSRDPFATCISRDLSARDPGNLRPRDPGKITHDLSRNWSSTKSPDQTRFGRASNPLINTWQIVGTINKTCPLNNQRTRDAT